MVPAMKTWLEGRIGALIRHSFGIGMKFAAKAPHAYIGIGQVADPAASELDSLEYTLEQARLAGNTKDAEKLDLCGVWAKKERPLLQEIGSANMAEEARMNIVQIVQRLEFLLILLGELW